MIIFSRPEDFPILLKEGLWFPLQGCCVRGLDRTAAAE
jgi:hypothetical protein